MVVLFSGATFFLRCAGGSGARRVFGVGVSMLGAFVLAKDSLSNTICVLSFLGLVIAAGRGGRTMAGASSASGSINSEGSMGWVCSALSPNSRLRESSSAVCSERGKSLFNA